MARAWSPIESEIRNSLILNQVQPHIDAINGILHSYELGLTVHIQGEQPGKRKRCWNLLWRLLAEKRLEKRTADYLMQRVNEHVADKAKMKYQISALLHLNRELRALADESRNNKAIS